MGGKVRSMSDKRDEEELRNGGKPLGMRRGLLQSRMMATGKIKPVRTAQDYKNALARIDTLMDAEPGSPEFDELDVLVDLVELYESKHEPMGYPSPLAALEFRMEQGNLRPRDLIPFIGSRAKVSEVLSGKRAITMPMARALHQHLGIPAEVLLREPDVDLDDPLANLNWRRFPVKHMAKLGWIRDGPNLVKRAETIIRRLIDQAGGPDTACAAFYRKKRPYAGQRQGGRLRAPSLVLAGAGNGQQASAADGVCLWYGHATLPQGGGTVELVRRRAATGQGGPGKTRHRPGDRAAFAADLSRRGRAPAQGRSAGGRVDPALRPDRQLLVLPVARTGTRRPPPGQQPGHGLRR